MYEDHGCSSRTISDAGSEERFRGHHLLDDSLLEDPPFLMPMPPSSTGCSDTRGCNQYDVSEKSLLTAEAKLSPQELNVEPGTKCTFQVIMAVSSKISEPNKIFAALQTFYIIFFFFFYCFRAA